VRNKFCVELGENSAETSEILKTAFGNDCSSRARKFEWFTKFEEGRNSGDDDPRPRRTSTSRNGLSAKFVPRVLNIEQNTACLSPLISFKRYKRIRTSWKSSSQVKRYGFTDTIRNETSFFAVEVARVSKTEDSVSGAFQSDSHDDFNFFYTKGTIH